MKIEEVFPDVKKNLGIDDSMKIMALREIWPLITSFDISNSSEPSFFDKSGNLVITVSNSTLSTELSMKKRELLNKLKEATKDSEIRFKDIRFSVRSK